LYSFNRELIDSDADRYFFVIDPVKIKIEGAPKLVGRAPLHPEHPERGTRELIVGSDSEVYVEARDLSSDPKRLRLKDLCNIERTGDGWRYSGNDLAVLKEGVQIVHWVPTDSIAAEVLMTDGTAKEGLVEKGIANAKGKVVQLERFAYARVEETSPLVRCIFTHK
jgi:glutamyl-tRNA synthetase